MNKLIISNIGCHSVRIKRALRKSVEDMFYRYEETLFWRSFIIVSDHNKLSSICLEIQQCRRGSMTLLCTGAFSLRLSQVDWNLHTTFERLFNVSARFSLVRYSVKEIVHVQITTVRKTIRKLGPNLEWVNCIADLLKMPLKLIIYNWILVK